jgi:parvulin-like peptidyl-prolyl isomerase
MLNVMRQHSRSLFIYIIFFILIAVFVINFGPGSQGCGSGISSNYAARVGSDLVPEQDFVHAFQLLGYDQEQPDSARARGTRQFLMELLLRRTLLAQEAKKMGFSVSDEEIEDRIAQGRILVVGVPRNITQDYRFISIYKDGFDYEKFRQNFCNFLLHTTPKKFIEEQRSELLAEKTKEVVRVSTKIAPEEVKREYEERETQVKLAFVRFGARRYEDELETTPAEVAAYLSKNKDKVKEQYDSRSFLYKAVPKEAHLRVISVEVAKDAPPADVQRAEAKAKALADKIKGGTDFAKVAKESSDDTHSKARGGDWGWKRKGATGLGAAFDDKVFTLKKGDTSDPIKTDKGYFLARVEGTREGDLPFDQVAPEIAEESLRRARGTEKAKQEAEAALVKVKAGAKLEALFPKDTAAADAPGKTKLDPTAPKLSETGFFARHGNMLEDIGITKDGAKQVFGSLKKGETAGPFDVQGGFPSYVIVQVLDRKDPDMKAFEAKKDELTRDAAATKWATVLTDLAHQKCVDARDSNKLTVNNELLRYNDQEAAYKPCSGLGLR